ncbi:MAG: uridylate kinase [Mycobacterium sp.]
MHAAEPQAGMTRAGDDAERSDAEERRRNDDAGDYAQPAMLRSGAHE